VSPLWRGTSDLNFPGNLLRRHHCSLNSDGTGSLVSLSWDHSAIDGHALQADHIATAQFAVDG
jgi:hypothetical protein